MSKKQHNYFVYPVIGAFCGFVFAYYAFVWNYIPVLYNCVSAPAILVAKVWIQIGLPPRGESAIILYHITFAIQWIIFGIVVGAWWGHRCKRRDSQKK